MVDVAGAGELCLALVSVVRLSIGINVHGKIVVRVPTAVRGAKARGGGGDDGVEPVQLGADHQRGARRDQGDDEGEHDPPPAEPLSTRVDGFIGVVRITGADGVAGSRAVPCGFVPTGVALGTGGRLGRHIPRVIPVAAPAAVVLIPVVHWRLLPARSDASQPASVRVKMNSVTPSLLVTVMFSLWLFRMVLTM